MQAQDYFGAVMRQMKNGGHEAMLYDLLHESLADFRIRKFPLTDALQDQKLRSLDLVEKWWLGKLQEGRLLASVEGWPTEVIRDELLQDCPQRGYSPQALRNQLAKLLPPGCPREGTRPFIDGKRKRTWVFPSLAACRSHFDMRFKTDGLWPVELTDPEP